MPRNDGIGGTPRLARYTSIGTPRNVDPTPNRPPLPKRTPGQIDPDRDWPFQLNGAQPRSATQPRSAIQEAAIRQANETARGHIPNRTTGECNRCGGVVAPCRPSLRALAILDRWDPSSARRIRAVLHLSGLMPAANPHDDAADQDDEGG